MMSNLCHRSISLIKKRVFALVMIGLLSTSATWAITQQGQCQGGAEQGKLCIRSSQCRNACVGGFDAGEICLSNFNCHSACIGGFNTGEECRLDIRCRNACVGGIDAGESCSSDIKCRDACVGGTRASESCNKHTDCPGGRCSDIGTCSDVGQCANIGTCSSIGRCIDETGKELQIKLIEFDAEVEAGKVVLTWLTSSELAELHIWRTRQLEADGHVEPVIIAEEVAAVKDHLTGGASYLFTDETVKEGYIYHYGLEGKDHKGHRIYHIELVDLTINNYQSP